MCWSLPVTAATVAVEVGTMLVMARRRCRTDVCILPLLATITIVESCELVQWLFVEERQSLYSRPGECHKANSVATGVTVVASILQPLFVNLYCWYTTTARASRPVFAFAATASAVVCVWMLAAMAISWAAPAANMLPGQLQQLGFRHLWGHTMCAYPGTHGHLQWSWALPVHELSPNLVPYSLLLCLPLAWYRPWVGVQLPFLAMGCMWLVWFIRFGCNLGETASVWCWSGLLLHGYYLLLPLWWAGGRRAQPADAGEGAACGCPVVKRDKEL